MSLLDEIVNAADERRRSRKKNEDEEMIEEAKQQLRKIRELNRKRFIKRIYLKIRNAVFRPKKKSVIDKSQHFELERLEMENFPSVREYEVALKEFEISRCNGSRKKKKVNT